MKHETKYYKAADLNSTSINLIKAEIAQRAQRGRSWTKKRGLFPLKPLHTIGKVSVNASIHKGITHYW